MIAAFEAIKKFYQRHKEIIDSIVFALAFVIAISVTVGLLVAIPHISIPVAAAAAPKLATVAAAGAKALVSVGAKVLATVGGKVAAIAATSGAPITAKALFWSLGVVVGLPVLAVGLVGLISWLIVRRDRNQPTIEGAPVTASPLSGGTTSDLANKGATNLASLESQVATQPKLQAPAYNAAQPVPVTGAILTPSAASPVVDVASAPASTFTFGSTPEST